jgi:putative membrane protein insertion efficiency factor
MTLSQRAALGLLRGYQLLFSPLFAGSCRFVPSCSAYATEAVGRYGVARGSWLALKRLSRCRPLAAHGFDPVPLLSVPDDSPAGTTRRRGHVLSHD